MANETTFNQVIGTETIRVSVPVTRVETILDRVDKLVEAGKLVQARRVIEPFMVGENVGKSPVQQLIAQTAPAKGAKKEAALTLIAKLRAEGKDRKEIIASVQNELQMTYDICQCPPLCSQCRQNLILRINRVRLEFSVGVRYGRRSL